MSSKILALIIALIAGVSMAIQGSINTKLGQVIGNWEAILVARGRSCRYRNYLVRVRYGER